MLVLLIVVRANNAKVLYSLDFTTMLINKINFMQKLKNRTCWNIVIIFAELLTFKIFIVNI